MNANEMAYTDDQDIWENIVEPTDAEIDAMLAEEMAHMEERWREEKMEGFSEWCFEHEFVGDPSNATLVEKYLTECAEDDASRAEYDAERRMEGQW